MLNLGENKSTHDISKKPGEPCWPTETVKELDRFVVGQTEAKKQLAKALRDRWRRMQISEPMRSEIEPKNVLMIGNTGVGKTEIARRLAKMTDSPFIKVEATKFTEVGYMGRDVEQIIRDLVEATVANLKANARKNLSKEKGIAVAEERVLDILVGENATPETRQKYLVRLRDHEFDDKRIRIQVVDPIGEIRVPHDSGLDWFTLNKLMTNVNKKTRETTVAEALKLFQSEEMGKDISDEKLTQDAIREVEQSGIVFIDEIDKICENSNLQHKGSVSKEGVQRDLLPLIEGTDVATKYGFVRTHHIWFICAGAFRIAKPEDMIAELAGRLHVHIRMSSLTKDDFKAILSKKETNLVDQYKALMAVDSIEVEVTEDGVDAIAEAAVEENHNQEDVGARRLQGLMSGLMHDFGYDVGKYKGQKVVIDKEFVANYKGKCSHTGSKFMVL